MGSSIIQDAHIRRLDYKRDLIAVASLIQICFSHQMDADGREYLRQVHEAARNGSFFRWVPGAGEMLAYPLDGYVWEENGTIVGNLTLLPFLDRGHWIYMIVNVAPFHGGTFGECSLLKTKILPSAIPPMNVG